MNHHAAAVDAASVLCSLAVLLLTGAAAQGDSDPTALAPRLPRTNLLVYRNYQGAVLPVKSVRDWRRRRAEIIRGMEEVMGPLPDRKKRCPLEVRVEEEADGGDYVRRFLTYASEPGSRVPAYLLIPKSALEGKGKAPGVLCLH